MSIEQILGNITILANDSKFDVRIVQSCGLFVILMVVMFIISVRVCESTFGKKTAKVLGVVFAGLAAISIIAGIEAPLEVDLLVSVDTRVVSEQELATYFEISDMAYKDGDTLVCRARPHTTYCNEVTTYLKESKEVA